MTEHDPSFDDNDELELEPLDPEIVKHQQERTKRKSREAEDAVDINAVYDSEELGDPIDLEKLKKFRFTTQHLLILTAVLAIVMTMMIRMTVCMGLFVSGCTALAAGWWFVMREERRRLEEIDRQREEFKQKLAARRAVEDGKPLPESSPENDARFAQLNAEWQSEHDAQPGFRFSFSMKELLITFTVAAVLLGFAQILGFQTAALVIGFIALVGLIVQAFGIELPPLIILGWWMLLVMYILISLWSAFAPATPA